MRSSIPTPEVPLTPAEVAARDGDDARAEGAPRTERRALGWFAVMAVLVVVWIAMPVGVGIFLGTLMAFTLQPLYERLKVRVRPAVAALITVLASMIGIAASTFGLAYLFVTKGVVLTRELIAMVRPGGPASGLLDHLTARAAKLGIPPDTIEEKLRDGASDAAARAASIAEVMVGATASALLGLFFAMLTMYFILRNWPKIAVRAQAMLPIRPDYTRALFEEFRSVGRTTLLGTVVTGLAQGLLATIGYVISGVPQPVFFGAATAVASLIPAVGTMLVWVPAGVVLIATGHLGRGVLELAWGLAVIVCVSDYIIRPRLVGGEGTMPALITFAALFGGVEVFGLKGLILGPVLMSLAVAVLRIYAEEAEALRRRAARRA
jgi:predicted PurR-regulated permease PerM